MTAISGPASDLAARLRGIVVQPADDSYEEARRVWNGTIDRHPALIVRCKGVADVMDSLAFARTQGLKVTVRGGGHHVAGGALNDGGLVLDLSLMRSVRVDQESQTVRAEGGATLGDIDRESQALSLAVPSGVVSDTGIGGLTLAGGVGWLRRRHGYTCDNLISADLVTADGSLVKASATENPDLFWALKGGGWRLGVVTSFEIQAYTVGPEVPVLLAFFPFDQAAQVLRGFRELAMTEVDDFSPLAVLGTIPAIEAYPREHWDRPYALILGPYVGPTEAAETVFERYRALGDRFMDLSGTMPWVEVQKIYDEDYPTGMRYYWKSAYLRDLDSHAIQASIASAAARPSALTTVDVWMLGGALGRKTKADSPLSHRDAAFLIGIEANWEEPADDAANIAWARDLAKALEPSSTGGSYLNFEDVRDRSVFATSHGESHGRLQRIKDHYDPGNLFG